MILMHPSFCPPPPPAQESSIDFAGRMAALASATRLCVVSNASSAPTPATTLATPPHPIPAVSTPGVPRRRLLAVSSTPRNDHNHNHHRTSTHRRRKSSDRGATSCDHSKTSTDPNGGKTSNDDHTTATPNDGHDTASNDHDTASNDHDTKSNDHDTKSNDRRLSFSSHGRKNDYWPRSSPARGKGDVLASTVKDKDPLTLRRNKMARGGDGARVAPLLIKPSDRTVPKGRPWPNFESIGWDLCLFYFIFFFFFSIWRGVSAFWCAAFPESKQRFSFLSCFVLFYLFFLNSRNGYLVRT